MVLLEGKYKDHEVQLSDFFKAKKMLKHITDGDIKCLLNVILTEHQASL